VKGAAILIVAAALAGCVTAIGPGVRADMSAQLASAQPAIAQCYAQALQRRPDARGTLVIAFAAAPSTGQFGELAIVRDQLRDPALNQCVVGVVGQLRMAQPSANRILTSIPVHFEPAR
jgi:hypothetical protein